MGKVVAFPSGITSRDEDWDDPHVSPTPITAADMLDERRIRRVTELLAASIRRNDPPDAA